MTIEKYKICLSLFAEGYEDVEIEINPDVLRTAFEHNEKDIWLYIEGYIKGLKDQGLLKKSHK